MSTAPLRLALRVLALVALTASSATVAEKMVPTPVFCAHGSGCEQVQYWAAQNDLDIALPVLGVIAFTVLFAGSMFEDRGTVRIVGALSTIGGIAAIGLLYLQWQIGAFCWLCTIVDSCAIIMGVLGILLLRRGGSDGAPPAQLINPWWGAWVLCAFVPIAWARTLPEPALPEAVRERYREGVVNVLEMADFECPYCRAMHPALRSAIEAYDGEVNVIRVIVPLRGHPNARPAARAYFCAVRQDKGEEMADALFASDDISRDGSSAIAERLELDMDAFRRCLEDPAIEREIESHVELAREAGMEGLPTVYIGNRVLVGYDPNSGEAPFRAALSDARAGSGRRVEWWWLAMVFVIAVVIGVTGALAVKRARA